MNPTGSETAKKPYKTPEVIDYGDIHEITQAVGNKGALDGVQNKNTH